MANPIKQMVTGIRKSRAGLTLAELLVVVGVIATLAAVVITITKSSSKGDQSARSSEISKVQAAMDAMMDENGITTLSGTVPTTSVNSWVSNPGTGATALNGYLRADTTKYFYCYNSRGRITRQDAVSTGGCP